MRAGTSCIIHRMQDALLVLETSCAQSSAAAWGGKELLCRVEWRAERNHSSAIFEAVRQALDALEGLRSWSRNDLLWARRRGWIQVIVEQQWPNGHW